MNAGKSTTLLQSSYNYQERGMETLILLPEIDTRFGRGKVSSRIGIEAEATTFTTADNLQNVVKKVMEQRPLHCVLVDEAQFLTKQQVKQLSNVADEIEVPVLAYGLRVDFQGNLFEGSQQLLAWADTMTEIKTICHCGRKATMVLRLDAKGRVIKDGRQVEIGGNERYTAVCRKHFKAGMSERAPDELNLLDPDEENV